MLRLSTTLLTPHLRIGILLAIADVDEVELGPADSELFREGVHVSLRADYIRRA